MSCFLFQQAFQIALNNDEDWEQEIVGSAGFTQVIDVHQAWCGPSKAIQSNFKRIYLDYGDKNHIKFFSADAAKVTALKEFQTAGCEPIFLFYKDGVKLHEIRGVNLPALQEYIYKQCGIN